MPVKSRKGNRRGFAGDDVTDNKDYIEEVVPQEDDSYVVEGTDSPDTIETESEVIDDQHNVIIKGDQGTEEEFLAESGEGEAEVIDEDGGESREGRRKGRKVARRGSRRGESDEDELEEDLEELEEDTEELQEDREGRRVARRGSRRGDTVNVITDEQGSTETVELPEPDEREGRRKGRKVVRRGSRRGESDPFEESFSVRERENVTEDIKSAFREEGLPGIVRDISATSQAGTNICKRLSNKWNCSQDAAEIIFDTIVSGDMLGSARQGSRKGSVYGGRSPEHQESIRSAVAVAMKDRRL